MFSGNSKHHNKLKLRCLDFNRDFGLLNNIYLEKILIQFDIFKRYYRCDIKGAESGLLAGKTVAIKDNVCVAGVPMMNGSKLLEGFVPDRDATIVTRILDAGIE